MDFSKAYNREEFVNFLGNRFLPEDFISNIVPVKLKTQMTYTTEAVKLGSSASLDLVVYEVKHNSKHDARVSLSKEAFRLLFNEFERRALVIFVPQDSDENYRLSLIEITLESYDDKAKVYRRYSNPRRYSYLLGAGLEGTRTIDDYLLCKNQNHGEIKRVVDYADLRERFSVEKLTKGFYQELSDWYAWAVKVVRFPNKLDDPSDDAQFNAESTIRLVTRLIFVWFLKQKHLIPEEFFDKEAIHQLIKGFSPDRVPDFLYQKGESVYYKAILQNLFFAMLNSPITPEGKTELSERHFRNRQGDDANNKLMCYESAFRNPQSFVDLANRTVPFLNGGLFDCLDDVDKDTYIDGFSNREKVQKSLFVPDYLFFIKNHIVDLSLFYNDKKKSKVKIDGIINILKHYNFTVEENTPFDQEVSLDPELLGKVFENLLASYNPETQTTARKQTGSFYTPREIVQYMVDESLVAHLKRTVGEDLEPQYRQLMQYTDDEVNLTDEQRNQIMQSLYNCKVLDPACGSGAFPMGMLQQMVHILNRIDSNNEMWKEMMLQQALDETSEAYRTASSDERREMVADIERSFDENVNRPDYARKLYLIENCIYGVDIQPIAIQISKLRFFISLVVDQKTNNNPVENFGIRPLPNLEAKFVAADTLIGLEKKDATLFDSDAIRAKKEELKIAKHKIFGAKTVYTKRKYRQIVNNLRLEIANMLEDCGAVGNAEAQQLASWDMFEQNIHSSFFDPEWMFDVKDGFDIVIANPPYIEFKKLPKQLKEKIKKYEVTQGKYDFFVAFIEKSQSLLVENGIHCFINPTTFMKKDYGICLRKFICNKFSIIEIVDFADTQIFESVTTYTGIYLFRNNKSELKYLFCVQKFKNGSKRSEMDANLFKKCSTVYKDVFDVDSHCLLNETWTFTPKSDSDLLNKIYKESSYRLKDITQYIFVGIQTGRDSVFFVRETDIEKYSLERALLYPILKGKDVNQYIYNWGGTYVIYPYGKDNKVIKESILKESYPNIYSYLVSRKEALLGREYFDASGKMWYELWCERNLEKFHQKKIVNSEIASFNKFAIDEHNFLGNTKVFNTVLLKQYEDLYEVIVGILNSRLMFYIHKNISTPKAGGAYEYKTQFIERYPIIIPRNIDTYKILVKQIMTAATEEKECIKEKMDLLVYRLYKLTYDEVLVVDPETPITREEYEKGDGL